MDAHPLKPGEYIRCELGTGWAYSRVYRVVRVEFGRCYIVATSPGGVTGEWWVAEHEYTRATEEDYLIDQLTR